MLQLALTACSGETKAAAPEGSSVTLVTDKTSYAPGEEVKVTLRNNTQGQVGYNLCFAFLDLQRKVGDRWETLQAADLGSPGSGLTDCTTILRMLPAGQSANGSANMPADLANGTYRLAHKVEIGNERTEIATDGFAVSR